MEDQGRASRTENQRELVGLRTYESVGRNTKDGDPRWKKYQEGAGWTEDRGGVGGMKDQEELVGRRTKKEPVEQRAQRSQWDGGPRQSQ